MKIEVVGCGYIGMINAYILSKTHDVSLVDINNEKLQLIRQKKPLFEETNFDWENFYSRISIGPFDDGSDAAIFCVNAEITQSGYDTSSLEQALVSNNSQLQIVRTTLGATEATRITNLFPEICYWPEFLREGSALEDFLSDPNFVYTNGSSAYPAKLASIIGSFNSVNDLPMLASVKSISNYFRALKVSFANQIGTILEKQNVDIEQFFNIFLSLRGNADHRYLRPGTPFGGLCLPKETEYVSNLLMEVFSASENLALVTQKVNRALIVKKCEKLLQGGVTELSIKNFSFKKGTSDLRNSPTIDLANQISKYIPVYDIDGSSLGKYPYKDEKEAVAIFDGWNSW